MEGKPILSAAQKEWAETIRAEKLKQMPSEIAELAVDPKGLLTHSKFWIEQRSRSASDIAEFVQEQKSVFKQYLAARDAGDHDKVKVLAGQYNALTDAWGFD